MAINFPSDPVEGQKYQAPGGPLYVWNGVAWVTDPVSGGVVTTLLLAGLNDVLAATSDAGGTLAVAPRELAQAIQARRGAFGLAEGSEAAFVLTLDPPPVLDDGLTLAFVSSVASGAAATLDVNGSGAFPLMTARGEAVSEGDVLADVPVTVILYADAWFLMGGSA